MHHWDDDRIYQRACVGLAREGHEVYLVATKPDIDIKESIVHFKWISQRKGLQRRWLSSREAMAIARDIEADIYHFHDPDLLPHVGRLRKWRKKAVIIYDVHENYDERIMSLKVPKMIKFLFLWIWRKFQLRISNNVHGIVTTTESMFEIFRSISVPTIAVSNMPYLSVLGNSNQILEKTPWTVYTSGTNSSKRNCAQTIRAIPLIKKEIEDIKFIFAGNYKPETYLNDLKVLARELGIEENVEFQGMMSWKENFARTARMEVGCVFYEDNVNNRLTIPNRLFEYMYSGVAVIGEFFPEVKKVIQDSDCGVVVDSSDPESIAQGIIKIFSDYTRLKHYQSNAQRAIIETYSFERELKRLIQFYFTLISR
jgi:glycosyltransferase involved in cell wall biosynthesis